MYFSTGGGFPQGHFGGGFSGSASNAAASSQNFNQGKKNSLYLTRISIDFVVHLGFGGHGLSGGASHAAAGSQTFNAGIYLFFNSIFELVTN